MVSVNQYCIYHPSYFFSIVKAVVIHHLRVIQRTYQIITYLGPLPLLLFPTPCVIVVAASLNIRLVLLMNSLFHDGINWLINFNFFVVYYCSNKYPTAPSFLLASSSRLLSSCLPLTLLLWDLIINICLLYSTIAWIELWWVVMQCDAMWCNVM